MAEFKAPYTSQGRPKVYDDMATTAETTLDLYTDLGKYCVGGWIINDSEDTNLLVAISNDGVSYCGGKAVGEDEWYPLRYYGVGSITGESISLSGMQIKKIKLKTSSGTADYRVFVF